MAKLTGLINKEGWPVAQKISIGSTVYDILSGKTNIGETVYPINFSNDIKITQIHRFNGYYNSSTNYPPLYYMGKFFWLYWNIFWIYFDRNYSKKWFYLC